MYTMTLDKFRLNMLCEKTGIIMVFSFEMNSDLDPQMLFRTSRLYNRICVQFGIDTGHLLHIALKLIFFWTAVLCCSLGFCGLGIESFTVALCLRKFFSTTFFFIFFIVVFITIDSSITTKTSFGLITLRHTLAEFEFFPKHLSIEQMFDFSPHNLHWLIFFIRF